MSLPNHPNYYHNQSLECFDKFADSRYNNHAAEQEMYMWLILYVMATLGEEQE